MIPEKLERITEFQPAYDKTDPDPKKNYGIHGVTLRMVVKGQRGAVQFVLYTNWMLPDNQQALFEDAHKKITSGDKFYREPRFAFSMLKPLPADVGYHSPIPMYEGQKPMGSTRLDFEDMEEMEMAVPDGAAPISIPKSKETGTFDPCEYLDGKPCYYDGSGLAANHMFEVLLKEGSDGVWMELENRYIEQFYPELKVGDDGKG